MAIVQNPITGITKKSLGNIIFYHSMGKYIIRSKPIKYKDKKSNVQVSNRNRFGFISKFISDILIFLKNSFVDVQGNMFGFNYFIQSNINYVNQDFDFFDISFYNLILFSKGSTTDVHYTSHTFISPILTINWDRFPVNQFSHMSDTLHMVILNFNEKKVSSYYNISFRSLQYVNIDISRSYNLDSSNMYCYLFYFNNQNHSSDSISFKI